jgi:pyruvate dehydrogenase E1 component
VELGIAEHNLFLALGAFGLTAELSGTTLLPIGTLYDPFVTRGLDALYHALYAGGRFIVAATPSGVSLSPEGGAHQSVITPGIGIALPAITYYEPAFAQEVEWILPRACAFCGARRREPQPAPSTKPIDRPGPRALPPTGTRCSGAYRLIDAGATRLRPEDNAVHLRGRHHGARGGGGEPRARRGVCASVFW